MPYPAWMASANRYVTNPVMRPLARRVPPWAVVVNRGRKTGREYRTPVVAFPTSDGFVIPLMYRSRRDWVQNVRAAGGCTLVRRGLPVSLSEPRVLHGDEALAALPGPVRPALRAFGVDEVLQLSRF